MLDLPTTRYQLVEKKHPKRWLQILKAVLFIFVLVSCFFLIYTVINGAGAAIVTPIASLFGIKTNSTQSTQAAPTKLDPNAYDSNTANICCDVFRQVDITAFLIRGQSLNCNNECNRCTNGVGVCACRMTAEEAGLDASVAITRPDMTFSAPFQACDGSFNTITNGTPVSK